MWGILALLGLLLLSMGRTRVDEDQAHKACEAVRGGMSIRAAARAFGVPKTTVHGRVHKLVAMDARVGPGTVLSKDEEDSLEDV